MELEIEAGDDVDIDDLVDMYRAKGYEADYKNLQSGNGYFARLRVSDGKSKFEIFIDSDGMDAMVKDIQEVFGDWED